MINNEKVLALIPARGGSKGLPGKNIKKLSGKPLIAWTIEEAKKADYIDEVIVSTDSKEIAEISQSYGASIPFMRPDVLATDHAKGIDVIKHTIEFFKDEFDVIIVLQPTSPLRTYKNINSAFMEFQKKKCQAVVSVCKVEHPIQWTGTLMKDKSMKNFINEDIKNKNRQDLQTYYRLNGAIYISKIDYLFQNNGFLGNNTFAYIMSKKNSVDIDSILDFKFAELLLREIK